ncbi:hypothetical protein [Tistrella mobilis]|uniref:hypothetical protein n=1 Tax=Tistrella mobilis TaxID=171437 RepID=UPI003558696B
MNADEHGIRIPEKIEFHVPAITPEDVNLHLGHQVMRRRDMILPTTSPHDFNDIESGDLSGVEKVLRIDRRTRLVLIGTGLQRPDQPSARFPETKTFLQYTKPFVNLNVLENRT